MSTRNSDHEHILPNGLFRRFTEHGGYPLVYVNDEGDKICSQCAYEEHAGTLAAEINYEEDVCCAACEEPIEAFDCDGSNDESEDEDDF